MDALGKALRCPGDVDAGTGDLRSGVTKGILKASQLAIL